MSEKKETRGRKKLPPGERKGKMFVMRIREADLIKLKRDADKAGLSVAKYLLKLWREKGDT